MRGAGLDMPIAARTRALPRPLQLVGVGGAPLDPGLAIAVDQLNQLILFGLGEDDDGEDDDEGDEDDEDDTPPSPPPPPPPPPFDGPPPPPPPAGHMVLA